MASDMAKRGGYDHYLILMTFAPRNSHSYCLRFVMLDLEWFTNHSLIVCAGHIPTVRLPTPSKQHPWLNPLYATQSKAYLLREPLTVLPAIALASHRHCQLRILPSGYWCVRQLAIYSMEKHWALCPPFGGEKICFYPNLVNDQTRSSCTWLCGRIIRGGLLL